MFEKLIGRFRRNSKNSSTATATVTIREEISHRVPNKNTLIDNDNDDMYSDDSDGGLFYKEPKEAKIVVVKLSSNEAEKYRDLMRQQDVNHSIIMNGYLRWKDIVNCMCVCKEWKEIIDSPPAYSMLFKRILNLLDQKYPVSCLSKNPKKFRVEVTDLKSLKEFMKFTLYSINWFNLSRHGYSYNLPLSATSMLIDIMSINPEKIIPLSEMKIKIPKYLQHSDPWHELISPSWNDEKTDFGMYLAFQSRFQYRFSFIALPYIRGEFYQVLSNPTNIAKTFVNGKFKAIEEDEDSFGGGRTRSYSNDEAYCFSISEFGLSEVDETFADDRYDLDEPAIPDERVVKEFNSCLRKMLFKVWKSGFLYYGPVRNFIFQLFFLLSKGSLYDFHYFVFHEDVSDDSVLESVEKYLSSRKGDSETFHSYAIQKSPMSGYSGGHCHIHYFFALELKESSQADECEFEFVSYQYFSHTVRGMALS